MIKAFILFFSVMHFVLADNEIYMDQSGATANIDLEQQGGSNLIGGVGSVAGTLTDFDFKYSRYESNRFKQPLER